MRQKSNLTIYDRITGQEKVLLLGSQNEIDFIRSAITVPMESRDELNKQVPAVSNKVIQNIFERPVFKTLIRYKLGSFDPPNHVKGIEWNWNDEIDLGKLGSESQIIVCKVPVNHYEWSIVRGLRERYGSRIVCLHQLILPFTALQVAQASLDYYLKSLEEIAPYYTGEKYWGPIDTLDKVFPLEGKSVIEFGPLDGCQTAGLIHAGAKSVTCIEARPENAIKCLIACYVFGWDHVNLIMDDFHNVNNLTYKRYDLAFAHGAYYHSVCPFIFLENLLSVSDNIFLGGYCATDTLPYGDYLNLDYFGKKYRAKIFEEVNHCTSGINQVGYFFHKDDLISFFHEKSYNVVILSDEESSVTAGKYLRFLAKKKI